MDRPVIPTLRSYSTDMPATPRRRLYMALVLFVGYVVMDWITYVFPARFGITPFNPEAALGIVLLMFCGARYVPLVFAAVLIGECVHPVLMRPLALIVINSVVLTAGYTAVALLLARRFHINLALDSRRDVLRLVGVTLACMLLCGVVYVGVLVSFGIGPADRYFNGGRRFFIGYSVGILIAAPLLFMSFSAWRRRQFLDSLRSYEAWLQVAAIAAFVGWVFLQDQQEHVRYFYVLFLPLVWAATRLGMVGAAGALALIQTGVYLAVYLIGYQPQSVFELQLLLIALALTGLLLGVSIDEQRRVAAEFRESLKLAAAGEMAAAITHEINQPLTALSGYAVVGQLIAASANPDRAQLNDTLRKLVEESQRTAAVVRRLRDFFRSGAIQLEAVDLGELARKVTTALHGKSAAANVTLEIDVEQNVRRVMVDPLQLEVVMRNLVQNAIDSAAERPARDGRVALSITSGKTGEVLVAVTDNGSGISEADKDRLFDSFVTTKTSGMGVGLAISRAIVDAHGGRIWAVPGDSGLLCFTLPTESTQVDAAAG